MAIHLYIIATNEGHARVWACEQGLKNVDWTYLYKPEQLRGISEGTVVILDTLASHPCEWNAQRNRLRDGLHHSVILRKGKIKVITERAYYEHNINNIS